MLDLAVVMITCDRTKRGGVNYLRETLRSITDSQLPDNAGFFVHSSDCGSEFRHLNGISLEFPALGLKAFSAAEYKLSPAENAIAALKLGARYSSGWVLFCEDDIRVCTDFFGSVERWLVKHATPGPEPMLYSFGASYPMPAHSDCWLYPVEKFYGTQCFAVRARDARDIADFLASDAELAFNPGTYDLAIFRWACARGITHFRASNPSLVQHIGERSSIRADGSHFEFASFTGEAYV